MVIVGHMSSKSAFSAKNTGQKFLTPKNFWWCRNVCPDPCPRAIFGAGQLAAPSFSRAGRGRVENFRGRGGPGQPFCQGAGRGGHPCSLCLASRLQRSAQIGYCCLNVLTALEGTFWEGTLRGAFFAWRAPILSWLKIMCSQVRMLTFLEPSREML